MMKKELCGSFQIKGFPTIKFFPSEQAANPYQKGMPWKNPTDYQGPRTSAGIVQFATNSLPNFVTSISSKSLEKFLQTTGLAKVILFTDKSATPMLFKGMAAQFHKRLLFGEVKQASTEIVSQFEVTTFPTILVVKEDGEKVVFSDPIKANFLQKFLDRFAIPKKPSNSAPPKNNPPPPPPPKAEEAKVYKVTNKNEFEEACLSWVGTCLLSFLAPDESPDDFAAHLSTLDELSQKYKGQFRFLWVDGPNNMGLVEKYQMMSGFPSTVLVSHKKKAFVPFIGTFQNSHLSNFLEKVRGKKPPPSVFVNEIPTFDD